MCFPPHWPTCVDSCLSCVCCKKCTVRADNNSKKKKRKKNQYVQDSDLKKSKTLHLTRHRHCNLYNFTH